MIVKEGVCLVVACAFAAGAGAAIRDADYGERLSEPTAEVALWWASSGWKVGRTKEVPQRAGDAVAVSAARNEAESVQLVVTPRRELRGLRVTCTPLTGRQGATIPAESVDVLVVRYVNIAQSTDKSMGTGLWPDPLPPHEGALDLAAGVNQPFWLRVRVPRDAVAGVYEGRIRLRAEGYAEDAPLRVTVYGFTLPERMTCVTAFGFSAYNMFRYHGAETQQDKRALLAKYWRNLSDHHISPYDPAPLDRFGVSWPNVKPPPSRWKNWDGVRTVDNEVHAGKGALLIYDTNAKQCTQVTYKPRLDIPEGGLRLRFRYRTAVPGHSFLVSFGHYDESGKWLWGCNNDMVVRGNGHWQEFDRVIGSFPKKAKQVSLRLYATEWSDVGERMGLVWYDDVSVTAAGGGEELVEAGDFEPRGDREPVAADDALQVRFDFAAWDREMTKAIDRYHFNSFKVRTAGMGGGTFHAHSEPFLRGFAESTHEYRVMFHSYYSQLEAHLAEKGWLDEGFVYWFDEPAPHQYAFVRRGFQRLKQHCPRIKRMLTEQVEDGLVGGPNIWCPVSHAYNHERAEERRGRGEDFWWYVCCGPKAPYTGLFIDHAGTEMRVWLWQTWKRKIKGILVWQSNYWTSDAAYPNGLQNPYEDPMSWTSGYSTPIGTKRPWGNGDGRFVYPPEAAADGNPAKPVLAGPVDSIRWEMLRDGIEDYEYFVVLQRLLEGVDGALPGAKRAESTGLLTIPGDVSTSLKSFTRDPAPLEAHRERLARAIERLQGS